MATSPGIRESISEILSIFCAVCYSTFTEPKLLDCAHTFCLSCLTNVLRNKVITCPICRARTNVPGGDVANLKTNLALKSIVDDVAYLEGKCDTCDDLKLRKNLSFCSACCKFMCVQCTEKHDKDERNSDHNVGNDKTGRIEDVSSATNNPPQCVNHEKELSESVCIQCNVPLCKHCIKDHKMRNHRVKSNTTYIFELFADAYRLKEDFRALSNRCTSNVRSCMTNEQKIKFRIKELIKAIYTEYEKALVHLTERKDSLRKFCDDFKKEAFDMTTEMTKDSLESLSVARSAEATIESMLQSPFSHIALNEPYFEQNREKLKEIRNRIDEHMKLSNQVVETAENLRFVENHYQGHTPIGSLEKHTWGRTDVTLRSDKMTDTAVRSDGKVAVGYFDGGIELINKSDSEGTILKHVKVLAIAWFPNGDLAVRDIDNDLSIYDTDLERSNVSFTTLGHDEGGEGLLVVNSASEILMSYRHVFEIHFFRKKGGKAFHVIKCINYVPQQLVPTLSSDILVMDASVMRIIDKQGNNKSQLVQSGYFGYPAILNDGSVIIAWVKEDEKFVRIEHYTHELRSKNKILEASLGRTARKWYKLQAISCNMIYLCSPNTMHLFWLNKTSVGDEWSTWL